MNKSLAIAYAMKKKSKKMAYGGHVADEAKREAQYDLDDNEAHMVVPMTFEESDKRREQDDPMIHPEAYKSGGMIDRIMSKRKMMASGGMIEHKDIHHPGAVERNEGMDELSHMADGKENDFDFLTTGDHELDDSTTNSGEADGDFLGNKQEDEDRSDIISRIMKSRAKKDRMPRPA